MKHIFANWKMYLSCEESIKLAQTLVKEKWNNDKSNVAVFPNTLCFVEVKKELGESTIKLGAQTVNWCPRGAYTGAVSADLFREAGASYTLVGHSERRYIFGESNEDVRNKIEAALAVNLTPVLCVGETQADLDENKREYRLKKQLMKAMENLNLGSEQNFIIAYEPVWAISQSGKGVPCSPTDADDVQGWIKNEIKQYTDNVISVLYGGSVNAENVVSYISRDTIDGVLVGGASTKIDSLLALIRATEAL